MKISSRLVLNKAYTISRFDAKYQKAQAFLDNEVVKHCTPFVPMRTGELMRSGIRGTKPGSGKVVYNAPYAKRMYYGINYHFSKDLHPQACAQWFEKAKGIHRNAWMAGVKKIIKG